MSKILKTGLALLLTVSLMIIALIAVTATEAPMRGMEATGFAIRIQSYNGKRNHFKFNTEVNKDTGYRLVEFGALSASVDNYGLYSETFGEADSILSGTEGNITAGEGIVKSEIYKNGVYVGNADTKDAQNVKFTVSIVKYKEKAHMMSEVITLGYEVWEKEGRLHVLYTKYPEEGFGKLSLYSTTVAMLQEGIVSIDSDSPVWQTLVSCKEADISGTADEISGIILPSPKGDGTYLAAARTDSASKILFNDTSIPLEYKIAEGSRYILGKNVKLVRSRFLTDELYDKLLGGWLGESIGVSWMAQTEWDATGRMMEDSEIPVWTEDMINELFKQDDIYVELPFIKAMIDNGFDCSPTYMAENFKNTEFMLWEGNEAARKNLLNGIGYPDSGYYENNFAAESLDWQIESDFVGILYPGLVNDAAARSFDIGHVIGYADGAYGGAFMAAMHAAAYNATSLEEVWRAGVEVIPTGSPLRACLNDVVKWYEEGCTYEEMWQRIEDKWFEVNYASLKKGSRSLDVKLSSAYILAGMLYGEGDFEKTIILTTKYGQDSDCTASSVAGVLGNYLGASRIDEKFSSGMSKTELIRGSEYTFDGIIEESKKLMINVLASKGMTPDENGIYTISAQTPVELSPLEKVPTIYVRNPETAVTVVGDIINIAPVFAPSTAVVASCELDFGDESGVYTEFVDSYRYAEPGTYEISLKYYLDWGDYTVFTKTVTIEKPTADLDRLTPICNILAPQGGGQSDIKVIADSITSTSNSYDTFIKSKPAGEDYYGYLFAEDKLVDSVVFTSGAVFNNGGWFEGGIRAEAFIDGAWTAVPFSFDGNSYPESGEGIIGFTAYTMKLADTVSCRGIRVIGRAGGSGNFTSCVELSVGFKSSSEYKDSVFCTVTDSDGHWYGNDLAWLSTGGADSYWSVTTYRKNVISREPQYFGYTYAEEKLVKAISYSDGTNTANGGWFLDGDIRVEVLIDHEWIAVEASVSPEYASRAEYDSAVFPDGTTYKLTLTKPVVCNGVRVGGTPGGAQAYIEFSELSVEYTIPVKYEDSVFCTVAPEDLADGIEGSKDIGVINDGVVSTSGWNHYCAFGKVRDGSPIYFGYTYSEEKTVKSVVYAEGNHFGNGGWYKNGDIKVEVLVDHAWIEVPTTVSPAYPVGDEQSVFGANCEIYTFTLDMPVNCYGVRVGGTPGGTKLFVSCSELTVEFAKYEDSVFSTVASEAGYGMNNIDIISDGNADSYWEYNSWKPAPYSAEPQFIGYTYADEKIVKGVVYRNGSNNANGGWFLNGDIRVEAYVDFKWVEVEATVSPEYPVMSTYDSSLISNFTSYTITLDTPVRCHGVRIGGTPGGNQKYICCSELTVNFITPIEYKDSIFCSVDAPEGRDPGFDLGWLSAGGADAYWACSTYKSGVVSRESQYFGYTYADERIVSSVSYSDGINKATGGWFLNGDINVEVLVDYEWKKVPAVVSYPNTGTYDAALLPNGATYKLTLVAPVKCYGVRVGGTPGGEQGYIECSELSVEVIETMAYTDNVFCTVTNPQGSGSRDISVIADGNTTGAQYDTFIGTPDATPIYYGYTYSSAMKVKSVVFTEGIHGWDGGWFKDGDIGVELLIDGEWVKAETAVSPAYPNSDAQADFGSAYETYTFTLAVPTVCNGVRVGGTPGGAKTFVSCAELRVDFNTEMSVTVDGVELSSFSILSADTAAARNLNNSLSNIATGRLLPLASAEEAGKHYIVLEQSGLVSDAYGIKVENGNIYISGSFNTIDRAVADFCGEYLGSFGGNAALTSGEGTKNVYVTDELVDGSLLDAALYNEGNTYRFKELMKKAERGEEIVIATLGGSITEGTGASSSANCYASLVADYLRSAFPTATVTLKNAGIGATGSAIGVYRLGADILAHDPDLVIVEYAVNDTEAWEGFDSKETYENIVRQCLEKGAAVISLCVPAGADGTSIKHGVQNIHKEVGAHYNIPVISVSDALKQAFLDGTVVWSQFGADSVHPNNDGHKTIASFVNAYLARAFADIGTEGSDEVLPAPLTSEIFKNAAYYSSADITPVSYGSFAATDNSGWFQFKGSWVSDGGSEVDPIVFELTDCKTVSLMYLRTVTGSGYSDGRVTVEAGGQKTEINLNAEADTWGKYSCPILIFRAENETPQAVKISIYPGEGKFDLLRVGKG